MKSIAVAALFGSFAQGHYIFSELIVNGQAVGADYSHIRKNTNSYQPSFTSEIVNSEDLRCNKGATTAAATTYAVKAGDKIGFKLSFNEFIEHPGPAFVYMSKAPGDVSSYDGSGDWFKAYEAGLCSGTPATDASWCTWQKDRIEFTIPTGIEDGEYLVRPEHIAIHEGHVGKAQFYMECAQLRITGGSGGTPSPLVKIPGLYSAQDPGIAFDKWNNPTSYTMPGPKVATFGGASAAPGTPADNSTTPSPSTAPSTPSDSAQPSLVAGPAVPSNGAAPVQSAAPSDPFNGMPQNGQPQNGQPQNGQPTNGQPTTGQPMTGQPTNGQPTNGQPQNGQPQGQPTGWWTRYNRWVGQRV